MGHGVCELQVMFFLLWLEKLTVVNFLIADAFAIATMGLFALLFWRASSSNGRELSLAPRPDPRPAATRSKCRR